MKSAAYLATAACAGLFVAGFSMAGVGAPLAQPGTTVRTATAVAPATAVLRMKFTVGMVETYHLFFHISGTVTPGAAAAMPMDETMYITVNQTVQSIDPKTGAATVKGSMATGTTTLTVNGKQMPTPQQTAGAPPMIITSVIEPSGKVDNFHMDAVPGSAPMMQMDSSNPMFGAIFAPDNAVAIGDTWSRTMTNGPFGMNCSLTYKLSDLSTLDGAQVATVDSTLNGNLSSSIAKPAPTTINGTFSGTQSTLFDNTAGIVKSVKSTSHILMVTAPDTSQPPPAGMNTPPTSQKIDLVQEMTMTLVAVK